MRFAIVLIVYLTQKQRRWTAFSCTMSWKLEGHWVYVKLAPRLLSTQRITLNEIDQNKINSV